MLDFYQILKGLIDDTAAKDNHLRAEIYERTRDALENQLDALDPPLPPEISKQQRQALVEAIILVEKELSEASRDDTAPSIEAAPQTDTVSTAAQNDESAAPEPAVAASEPAATVESVGAPEPVATAPNPVVQPENTVASQPITTAPEPVITPEPARASEPASVSEPLRTPEPVRAPEPVVKPEFVEAPKIEIPGSGSTVSSDIKVEPAVAAPVRQDTARFGAEPSGNLDEINVPPAADIDALSEPRKKSSGVWSFLTLILLVGIGAVGGLIYWQPSKAADWFGVAQSQVDSWVNSVSSSQGGAVIISPSTETPQPETSSTEEQAPSDNSASENASADSDAGSEENNNGENETTQVAAVETPEQEVAVYEGGQAVPVVGLLLLENPGAAEDIFQGTSNWTFDSQTQTLNIDVKFEELNRTLSIRMNKNTDTTLPASHMLEFDFKIAEGDKEGQLQAIPGILSRTGRGVAGVGFRTTGALIVPGQYLMGLFNDPESVQFNTDLLKNAKWLDVPVLFESNRRGVVAIERGETGDAAVASALEAWSS